MDEVQFDLPAECTVYDIENIRQQLLALLLEYEDVKQLVLNFMAVTGLPSRRRFNISSAAIEVAIVLKPEAKARVSGPRPQGYFSMLC